MDYRRLLIRNSREMGLLLRNLDRSVKDIWSGMDFKGARGFGGTPGWRTNRYYQSKYHVINGPKIKLIKYTPYALSIRLLRSSIIPTCKFRTC